MPEQSILDARLAEIDRRLRTIQSGLAPGDDLERTGQDEAIAAPPSPPALRDELAEAGRLVARLHELTAAHDRLLASSRELLTAFADALAGAQPTSADPRRAEPRPAIGLAAGPFADTAALRRFKDALSALPDVRAVAVREYAGTDRVIVDVHLSEPTS
jgi:hypothetical protein